MPVIFAALVLTASAPAAVNLAPQFVLIEAPEAQPYASWPRDQLEAERDRLDASRPPLRIPLTVLAAGVGLIGSGVGTVVVAGIRALLGPRNVLGTNGIPVESIVYASIAGGLGVVGLIVGLVLVLPRLFERRAIGRQLDQVEEALERSAPPASPVPLASGSSALLFSFPVARF